MKRSVIAALPFVTLMMGCPSALHGPSQQARAILASDASVDSLLGHIGRPSHPTLNGSSAVSAFSKSKVAFAGFRGDLVCFSQVDFDSTYAEYRDLAAAARASTERVRKQRWTFEAREGFDDLAGKKWVTSPEPASQLTSATTGSFQVVAEPRGTNVNAINRHTLATQVGFCGARPPMTPATRYLVATYYPDDLGAPKMFIWEIARSFTVPPP